MKLRQYQQIAVDKTREFLRHNDRALLVAYTASGKSVMCAELIYLASMKKKRVLMLVHTKELVKQNSEKFQVLCASRDKDIDFSICCSGIAKPCTKHDIVFASPQTFVNTIDNVENFDLIIIDEAHRIPSDDESVYQRILSKFKCKAIGMTATPYRDNNQLIYGDKGYFDGVSHTIDSEYLLGIGCLTPYKPYDNDDHINIDTDSIETKANGTYVEQSHANAFCSYVDETVSYTIDKTKDNKKVMIFCVNVAHAKIVHESIDNSIWVHGKMSKLERDCNINKFKTNEDVRYMVNVGILTTGFDYPAVDCIVFMRAIQSFNLYLQCVGRAQRLHKSKEYFNVIDFGNNITRFGGVYIDELPSPKSNSNFNKIQNDKHNEDSDNDAPTNNMRKMSY